MPRYSMFHVASPASRSAQKCSPHLNPSGNIFVAEAQGPKVKHPVTGAEVEAGFRAQKFTFTGVR